MSPTYLPIVQKNKRVNTGWGQKVLRCYNGYKHMHSLFSCGLKFSWSK